MIQIWRFLAIVCLSILLFSCAENRSTLSGYEAILKTVEHDISNPQSQEKVKAEVFEITKQLSHIASCSSRYLLSADHWLEMRAGLPGKVSLKWSPADQIQATKAWFKTRAILFESLGIKPQMAYGTTKDSK